MKVVAYILLGLFILLQYPLWLGSGGVFPVWRLHREIAIQEKENAGLQERNLALQAEVVNLKSGLNAIEERARSELGMIKKNETFYQLVEASDTKPDLRLDKSAK